MSCIGFTPLGHFKVHSCSCPQLWLLEELLVGLRHAHGRGDKPVHHGTEDLLQHLSPLCLLFEIYALSKF